MSRPLPACVLAAVLLPALAAAGSGAGSAGGGEILFSTDSGIAGVRSLGVVSADGRERALTRAYPASWAAAVGPGGWIYLAPRAATGLRGVWRMRLDGSSLRQSFRVRGWARIGELTFAPDRRRIALDVWGPGGDGRAALLLVRLDGSLLRRLPANHDLNPAAWSPDGRRVAFVNGAAIYTAAVAGGPVRRIGRLPTREERQAEAYPTRLQWSPDGRFVSYSIDDNVFPSEWEPRLEVAPAAGGPPVRLGEGCCWVTWAPNGRELAFWSGERKRLVIIRRDGRDARPVPSTAAFEQWCWSPDGRRLVAGAAGWRTAALLDVRRMRLRAIPAARGARLGRRWCGRVYPWAAAWGGRIHVGFADGRRHVLAPAVEGDAAWSPDGTRVAFVRRTQGISWLQTVAANGSGRRTLLRGGGPLLWAPEGRTIAFADRPGSISLVPAAGGRPRRLGAGVPLAWSPDGTSIAARAGNDLVTWDVATGRRAVVAAGVADLRCDPTARPGAASWSPDSSRLYFAAAAGAEDGACSVLSSSRDGSQRRVLGAGELATLSPVGGRLATGSAGMIAILDADGSPLAGPWPGRDPSWSSDGAAIAYVDGGLVWARDADGGRPRALTSAGARAAAPVWRPGR